MTEDELDRSRPVYGALDEFGEGIEWQRDGDDLLIHISAEGGYVEWTARITASDLRVVGFGSVLF